MVTQQFTGLSTCQLLSHGIDGHAEFAFRQDCAISRLMFRDVVAVVNQKLEAENGKIGKTLWRLPLRGSEVFS